MKKCELCPSAASMYCDSDSASLCWDCDAKVHSANFLVERHSRSLLCHVCCSPTAWSASGPSLPRTLSLCLPCLRRSNNKSNQQPTQQDREEEEREFDTEDDECDTENDNDDDDDDDGDGDSEDEQVVPSPPASSSESSSEKGMASNKRLRGFSSDDDFGCSSSHVNAISFLARDSGASVRVDSFNRIKRLRAQSDKAEAVISGTCGLDQDTSAVRSASDDSS